MTQFAAAAGGSIIQYTIKFARADTKVGYPIATLPLDYLDFNGRPHGLAAIAAAHQEATLIQLQSAWEVASPARKAPPL